MPSPPQLETISVNIDSEAIAIVKYNRPKNGNALNTKVLEDLLSALRWAESEDNIRIIVTSGEGRFYTAGLDLLDKKNQSEGQTINDTFIQSLGWEHIPGESSIREEMLMLSSTIHELLINTDKLVISAVNGPAPGWGTTSIALSDMVYAAPDALFFTPFVQWGLCAEGCSSLTFMRIMGRQKASALILGGQRMSAQELESAGLITKILSKDDFMEDVLKIVRGIAKLPPQALKVNKNLLMRNLKSELLETNKTEMELLRKQARSQESLSAIAGFAEETERKKKEKSKL